MRHKIAGIFFIYFRPPVGGFIFNFCERMMRGVPAFFALFPFKHRKIAHKKKGQLVGIILFHAQIRLVGIIPGHRLAVSKTRKGVLGDAFFGVKRSDEGSEKFFHQRQNVMLINKTHLNVKLGKFRLAVLSGVLIPKTARHLKIFFNSGHHQKLFVLLGGLRESIERARMKPRRNEIVARSLGRRLP